jgi:hypothetical protein
MYFSLALGAVYLAAAAATEDTENTLTFSSLSAEDLVANYLRNSQDLVQIRNVASSSHSCFALFDNGHSVGRNAVSNQFLLPNKGVIMSTGNPEDFHTNDSEETSTNFGVTTGDIHLEQLKKEKEEQVLDPCFIEFEASCPEAVGIYTPQLTFNYVFGSEEYFKKAKKPDDVETAEEERKEASDVLGLFLNDENIALVPHENGGLVPVSIKDVHEKKNEQYFVNNKATVSEEGTVTSAYDEVEADGFTTKLTAHGAANPGWNTVKIAIGDLRDGDLDSWVLIEAGSLSCALGEMPESSSLVSSATPSSNPSSRKLSGVAIFFIILAVLVAAVFAMYKCGVIQVEGDFKLYVTYQIQKMQENWKTWKEQKFGSKKVNPDLTSQEAVSKKVDELRVKHGLDPVEEGAEAEGNAEKDGEDVDKEALEV